MIKQYSLYFLAVINNFVVLYVRQYKEQKNIENIYSKKYDIKYTMQYTFPYITKKLSKLILQVYE